jgi:hypothetical protein
MALLDLKGDDSSGSLLSLPEECFLRMTGREAELWRTRRGLAGSEVKMLRARRGGGAWGEEEEEEL